MIVLSPYAAYPLTQYPQIKPVAGICEAIDQVLAAITPSDGYRQVRQRLHQLLAEYQVRQQTRLAGLTACDGQMPLTPNEFARMLPPFSQ